MQLDRLRLLTAAAAKDYNDELTLILNHADLAQQMLGPCHPASDSLVELAHAVVRCAEISRCLLKLSHADQAR